MKAVLLASIWLFATSLAQASISIAYDHIRSRSEMEQLGVHVETVVDSLAKDQVRITVISDASTDDGRFPSIALSVYDKAPRVDKMPDGRRRFTGPTSDYKVRIVRRELMHQREVRFDISKAEIGCSVLEVYLDRRENQMTFTYEEYMLIGDFQNPANPESCSHAKP